MSINCFWSATLDRKQLVKRVEIFVLLLFKCQRNPDGNVGVLFCAIFEQFLRDYFIAGFSKVCKMTAAAGILHIRRGGFAEGHEQRRMVMLNNTAALVASGDTLKFLNKIRLPPEARQATHAEPYIPSKKCWGRSLLTS